MTDTTFHPTDEQWKRMVHMHDYQDGRAMYDPLDREHIFEQLPLQYFCGGAGLASTLSDYEKFADMLLRGGKTADGEVLIGEEYIRLMRTVAIPEHIMPGNQKWGLGMRVICDASYAALPVNTFGWSGAYGTHFWVDPDNGVVGIYMKNSKFDGGSGAKTAADFERNVYLP
jgi:CubicO group peptidase (beta-lactamase class C family)